MVLLAAGLIFWLDRLGRLDAGDYLRWWPVALIAIGLAHLPQRRWIAGLAWIVIGVVFLPQLGIAWKGVTTLIGLWPLMITIGGLSLIGQALRPKPRGTSFNATAVMAGNTMLVGSQELAGADVVAIMGGCDVDLRGAKDPLSEVTINVLAFWGGIEIRVPSGWQIVDRVTPILGGFEDKSAPARENAPRVVIRGTAIMGGVEVISSEVAAK
jgi:hypothetical protein